MKNFPLLPLIALVALAACEGPAKAPPPPADDELVIVEDECPEGTQCK